MADVSVDSLWSRNSGWWQGALLPESAYLQLISVKYETDDSASCAIVISHDCDIANDNLYAEPDVEVALGRFVDTVENNYKYGKSTRVLHLEYDGHEDKVTVEIISTKRFWISKNDLASFKPDGRCLLSPENLGVLRTWLAARYRRAAFPDRFVDLMDDLGLRERLPKLCSNQPHISGVYFKLNEMPGVAGVEFDLAVVIVYVSGDEPSVSEKQANSLVAGIEELFKRRCYGKKDEKNPKWTGIRLERCFSVSEDDLTVRYARLLTDWPLDYISNKDGDFLEGANKV